MKPIFSIFSSIAILPFTVMASIVSSLASDLQNGIAQFFSIFGQFISYLIDQPTNAWAQIAQNFGNAFKPYGVIIPIMLVVVFSVTVILVIIIIQIAHTVDEGASPMLLMGGME